MLNPDRNNTVHYTPVQKQAISTLIANRGNRTGKELWNEAGPNDIFISIKESIKAQLIENQKCRCAYCEAILEYGGTQIEHYAPKSKYPVFLYEPLNLVCSCPVCNGPAKKGRKDTIAGQVQSIYYRNSFKYVHPYLDNVDTEIKYYWPSLLSGEILP